MSLRDMIYLAWIIVCQHLLWRNRAYDPNSNLDAVSISKLFIFVLTLVTTCGLFFHFTPIYFHLQLSLHHLFSKLDNFFFQYYLCRGANSWLFSPVGVLWVMCTSNPGFFKSGRPHFLPFVCGQIYFQCLLDFHPISHVQGVFWRSCSVLPFTLG